MSNSVGLQTGRRRLPRVNLLRDRSRPLAQIGGVDTKLIVVALVALGSWGAFALALANLLGLHPHLALGP